MSKVVMVVGAFICAVIGGLIAQAIAGSKGFTVGAVIGFAVGFCVIGFLYGQRDRKKEAESTTGPTQEEE
jgi:outer membrane lipoprotein SlyB